jgi:hypothetical protein
MGLRLDPDQPILQPHFRSTQPQFDQLKLLLPTTLRRSTPHYRTSTDPRGQSFELAQGEDSDVRTWGAARFRETHRTGRIVWVRNVDGVSGRFDQ